MTTTALAPLVRRREAFNSVVFGNAMASVLLSAEDTGGYISVMEIVQRPGTEPPYHVHQWEDEIFYVLEGHITVMVDGVLHEAGVGDCVFLPRLLPHTFRVRSERARALVIVTPGGFENYFRQIGVPVQSLEASLDQGVRPDYFEMSGRAAGRHGVILATTQPNF